MSEKKMKVFKKNVGKGRKSVRSLNSWVRPPEHNFLPRKNFSSSSLPSEKLTEVNVI